MAFAIKPVLPKPVPYIIASFFAIIIASIYLFEHRFWCITYRAFIRRFSFYRIAAYLANMILSFLVLAKIIKSFLVKTCMDLLHLVCLPELRQAGAARNRHHGHVRQLVMVFRALHRSMAHRAHRPQGGRRMAAGRSVYRRHRARDPASALQPVLHPRDEDDRPRRSRRAVRRPVHAGHGRARDLPRANGEWVDAGRGQARRRRRRAHAPRCLRPASRSRSAASRRCRSRRRTPSTPTTSWRRTAPMWRAGSCCPIRRPSATSNGPSAACRAPGASSTGCGGWSARRPRSPQAPGERPAEFSPPALVVRKAAHSALAKVPRHREAALQRLRRAYLRIRQRLGSAIAKDEHAGLRLGGARGGRIMVGCFTR